MGSALAQVSGLADTDIKHSLARYLRSFPAASCKDFSDLLLAAELLRVMR